MSVVMLCYIDDLLLFGHLEAIEHVKKRLGTMFTISDLGKVSYYLGVKITHSKNSISLSQPSFIKKIIQECGLDSAKPLKTPMELGHCLYDETDISVSDKKALIMKIIPYRQILGSLIHSYLVYDTVVLQRSLFLGTACGSLENH